ncbi:neuromedin U [Halomicronema sp. CCY15110]|uniref:neuromedin U n=1 Tax=Halomicronema sp. CCY15110 TaxID=2767773 RepID=UPI00194F3D6A|nr:neuromedin U [Halomicronema sp. CCY15110]
MEFSSSLIRWTTCGVSVAIATVLSSPAGWTAEGTPELSTLEPLPRSLSPRSIDPDARSVDKPITVSREKSSPVALPWSVAATYSEMTEVAASPGAIAAACTVASCLSWSPLDAASAPAGVASTEPTTPVPTPEIAQAADGAASSQADLAKASQNPIASLISVPLQNNTNFGVGEFDRTSNILNVQPVIPVPLSDRLTLVNRTIIPIAYQPELAAGLDSAFGLGDINYTGFLVPETTGNFTWGVGPSIVLPTATDTILGTGKWSIGPAAVGLVSQGPIVAGALVSQLWSFAGDSDRADISLLTVQPFFNYNFAGGWYATTSPIITANWQTDDDQWTVPLGGGGGRVFNIGSQPVNASLQAYWNALKPEGAADWTLRAQMTLLFP